MSDSLLLYLIVNLSNKSDSISPNQIPANLFRARLLPLFIHYLLLAIIKHYIEFLIKRFEVPEKEPPVVAEDGNCLVD